MGWSLALSWHQYLGGVGGSFVLVALQLFPDDWMSDLHMP